MNNSLKLLFLVLISTFIAFSQSLKTAKKTVHKDPSKITDKSSDLKGPYLGQNPPDTLPVVFAPGIISTENGWEAALSFSPDLNEVFFTRRINIEGTDNRIMYMKMINNVWTNPELAPFAEGVMEYEAFITPDNKKILFNSKREKPNTNKGQLWYSTRKNETWGEAKYFPGIVNQGWNMSVTSTLEGTLYFTGNLSDGYGIYRSRLINGEYENPEFMPKEINKTKYFGASHPYIAPDESYLIFDADAVKNSDLYLSFRNKNGSWTEALPLNQNINTKDYEAIATVSPDGKYLFFNRNNDIYWVDAKFIGDLKHKK